MSYPITDIEGVDSEIAAILKAVGIRSTERLLEAARTVKGRKALSERTGIDEKLLLKWANMADRMRIKGVSKEYAALLQAAGIDTVRELKYRNPARLARAMIEANAKWALVRLLPSEKVVSRWIEEARTLPVIAYAGGQTQINMRGDVEWPLRTRSRTKMLNPKKAEVSSRLLRYARRVFGDPDFAEKWFRENNPALKNRAPIDVANSEAGEREVEAVLSRFAHGDYA